MHHTHGFPLRGFGGTATQQARPSTEKWWRVKFFHASVLLGRQSIGSAAIVGKAKNARMHAKNVAFVSFTYSQSRKSNTIFASSSADAMVPTL